MKDISKAAIASILGAVIGYGVGTTFLQGWGQLIAVLTGGVVGWISFAPISLIKTGWSVVMTLSCKIRAIVRFFRDQKNRRGIISLLRKAIQTLSITQIIGTTISYFAIILTIVDNAYDGRKLMYGVSYLTLLLYIVSILCGLLASSFGFILNLIVWHKEFNKTYFNSFIERETISVTGLGIKKELLYFNPITAPFLMLYVLYKALTMLYMYTPKIVASVPRFFHFTFLVLIEICRRANSNGRMASFFGGASGTLIGLAFQDLVLGAVTGGVVALMAILIGSQFPEKYMKALWERYRHTYSS